MRKSKKDRLPPFTPTENSLIDSDAYKKLTNASRVAYLLLCRQRKFFSQPEVCFPYSDAQEYMDRNTWAKAIRLLEENGLISKTQEGGLYRRKNIYKIMVYSVRGMESHTVKNTLNTQTGMEKHTVDFEKIAPTVCKPIPLTVCKSPLECSHKWDWSIKDRKWKCQLCGILTCSKELSAVCR